MKLDCLITQNINTEKLKDYNFTHLMPFDKTTKNKNKLKVFHHMMNEGIAILTLPDIIQVVQLVNIIVLAGL